MPSQEIRAGAYRPPRRRGLLPAATVVLGFAAAIAVGTLLLLLPWSHEPGYDADVLDAAFTAVSAVTVTGLATVDTGTTWSSFGEVVILILIQLGGLGTVTSGTLLTLLVRRRLGLRTRLAAQQELPGVNLGDVRRIVRFALLVALVIEAVIAVVLTLAFWLSHGYGALESLWYGVFTSVSAFNNAGFALFPDSLIGFSDEPLVLLPVMVAIIAGGLGLPVYLDFRAFGVRGIRRWTVHTRLTLGTTLVLLTVGAVLFSLFESSTVSTGHGILNGTFASVTARTAGFNSIDYGAASEETILLTSLLMIIGGGSASTAGGIKVTTFIILILVVVAEARGTRDVNIVDRRMPERAIRTALAVTVSYTFLVAAGVLVLLSMSDESLSDVLFETVSAVATVGLSTGITPGLGTGPLLTLMLLMFVGRLGALTLASAFALRRTEQVYRLPAGTPIIG